MFYVYSLTWGYYNFKAYTWQDELDEDCYTDNYSLAGRCANTVEDAVIHTSISAEY